MGSEMCIRDRRKDNPTGSWSLGGQCAEEATLAADQPVSEVQEAPERRTRRTHAGRPCSNQGARVQCLPIVLFSSSSRGAKGTDCIGVVENLRVNRTRASEKATRMWFR